MTTHSDHSVELLQCFREFIKLKCAAKLDLVRTFSPSLIWDASLMKCYMLQLAKLNLWKAHQCMLWITPGFMQDTHHFFFDFQCELSSLSHQPDLWALCHFDGCDSALLPPCLVSGYVHHSQSTYQLRVHDGHSAYFSPKHNWCEHILQRALKCAEFGTVLSRSNACQYKHIVTTFEAWYSGGPESLLAAFVAS